MTLAGGTRLGPYEVVEPIGAGGMGEVYKARDTRIGRTVAIKILPADVEGDPDRRRRFHQEAVAAGALNHANLLVVHDVGSEAGRPFLVTELLHGQTLRDLLRHRPLPEERAVRYAAALLDGLAAAHAQGIVHRDVKPENIFITDADGVKILDFGLARLPDGFQWPRDADGTPTATAAGMMLGSVGYMAPEQVTGGPADRRTDLFSAAVVLHEMLTGRSPFAGDTAVQVLNAILTADVAPPPGIDPGLRAVLERGLQKSPARRFQSAEDFAFALRLGSPVAAGGRPRSTRVWTIAAVAALAAIAAAGTTALVYQPSRGSTAVDPPRFQRITFQQGRVWSARFIQDSDMIVYAASWNAEPNRIYSARPGFPAPTDLRLPPADLLGVSRSGELALLLGRRWLQGMEPSSGVLARASMGTAPREVMEHVTAGDCAPDGGLAGVRDLGGVRRLEFPLGRSVYETAGWLDFVRVSRDGTRIAFNDHPLRSDDRGDIVVVTASGAVTRLARDLGSAKGLAWSPDDREVWASIGSEVVALDMDGGRRTVFRDPRQFTLVDVASDGRLLIVVDQRRAGLNGLLAGDAAERDLTWFDYSVARELTPDGKALLFFESSEVREYLVGLWRAGDAAPVRIGDGHATSLSADGKSALAIMLSGRVGFRILPTGVGHAREVLTPAFAGLHWVTWLPDGRHVLVSGNEPGRASRLYLVDLAGRVVRTIGPEGTFYQTNAVSPDGLRVAAQDADRKLTIYRIDDGPAAIVPGVLPEERAVGWSSDGAELFVLTQGIPSKISRVNVATGARTPWRDLMPSDPAGVARIFPVLVTPDGRFYAYTYGRFLSTLYVVETQRP